MSSPLGPIDMNRVYLASKQKRAAYEATQQEIQNQRAEEERQRQAAIQAEENRKRQEAQAKEDERIRLANMAVRNDPLAIRGMNQALGINMPTVNKPVVTVPKPTIDYAKEQAEDFALYKQLDSNNKLAGPVTVTRNYGNAQTQQVDTTTNRLVPLSATANYSVYNPTPTPQPVQPSRTEADIINDIVAAKTVAGGNTQFGYSISKDQQGNIVDYRTNLFLEPSIRQSPQSLNLQYNAYKENSIIKAQNQGAPSAYRLLTDDLVNLKQITGRNDLLPYSTQGGNVKKTITSTSSEKLGPENPFGSYHANEDLSMPFGPTVKGADIVPFASGTPIGNVKLKPNDPNNPLSYLTSPYESMARLGFQATKGFSPYEEFKAEYTQGEFPFKGANSPSSSLVSAASGVVSDLIGGKSYDPNHVNKAIGDITGNPALAIGSTLGELPLFLLPVGEGAAAAKGGITTAAKAVPRSLSDLSITLEAGVRTTAGLTKTGTSALEALDSFNTAAMEKLVNVGSKTKSTITQPLNLAATELNYGLAPVKDLVGTKAGIAAEKLTDFGSTVKTSVVNPFNVAKTELGYGLAPTKDLLVDQSKIVANQLSEFGGNLKQGITNPVKVAGTEINYGLQPAKDFVSIQAENFSGKLVDTADLLNRNVKMPLDVFGTEVKYGLDDLKDILTPKVGTPGFLGPVAKGYRSARTAEAMFRYELDKPLSLPEEVGGNIATKQANKGFDLGLDVDLTPKGLRKFQTSFDINKMMIKAERAASKSARPASKNVFRRGFDFGSIGGTKTTKQQNTSFNPLDNINAQLSDFAIKPLGKTTKTSENIPTSAAGIMAGLGIRNLGLGGGANVFGENTSSLGLGGVTGFGRTRKSRISISESTDISRIPDVNSIAREFMQGFNERKAGKTNTRTSISQDLGFGNVQDFMTGLTGRQNFTEIQKPSLTPSRKNDLANLTGLGIDTGLKDIVNEITTPKTTTTPRLDTSIIPKLDETQRTRTKEPPRPEIPFGFKEQPRRRKKGKKGKKSGRTFGVRDPLSAFFGGKMGKDIQRMADFYG